MKENNPLNTSWRKTASTIYKKPVDSKIFGSVEIDITDLEKYIAEKRKSGVKITLTHFFMVATARAIKEIPELNTYVKRGNIYSHEAINATVSVLLQSGEMGSVKIHDADKITLSNSVEKLRNELNKTYKGDENATMQMKEKLAAIPWPLRGWVYQTIRYITTTLGISIPPLGLSANNFGSFILSNIGSIGLDIGYPALMPSANIAFVLILGGVSKKPWVVNDEIVPRNILMLGAALDHRVIDASHGGRLFKQLKRFVNNPELLETIDS
ncbi:catalytic domain-containing protein of components of various dehydrogenase complexes [Emticicia oligotrophica DSM 17448]|uniref:Catalytic domain-containing protein of components of various dehydrogenase complexes n=1 Tax=Emticicia oligotrophica (strain DSM 17448 / CIP 109782 / MTCC 6937 / GPTSA100-15) TaxID=929562 RepID=A0ABM5MZ92_EMTOG|nr:2-oxo acid dehydrogenase subunit E2 [Emticicia oligotrophica]AFK02442.1 catalytic domain-containing protein of components of various dehydrogenase complexes [Emticicia oligotrophica DSM 17448]